MSLNFTGISVEDIISKVTAYLELDRDIDNNDKSHKLKTFILLRVLYNCEHWLLEQFSIKEFRSLGYGDFPLFLEKHASLLPEELYKHLIGDTGDKLPLEAYMLNHQLVVLLSQASNNLWENGKITKEIISLLLMRQFPFISFNLIENGSVEDFSSIVAKHKSNAISKSVIFSGTLYGTSYAIDLAENDNDLVERIPMRFVGGQIARNPGSTTSKDAVQVLEKAPMLSDLTLWSHWDLLFAPSLGPFLPWLLNEVKTDALLCLVTRDGKVIRIDPSATLDSFLEAAVQGCTFQTAVQLLSLFSVVGGEKHVPESLLKCHAQYAFKVILKNSLENVDINDGAKPLLSGNMFCKQKIINVDSNFSSELDNSSSRMDVAAASVLRFVLDCLQHLPPEFRGFAADIFLSGMQSIVKDAASAILCECSKKEERLMLHEIGLSCGILEWINDYHAFCSSDATDLITSAASSLKEVAYEQLGSKVNKDTLDKSFAFESEIVGSVDEHNGQHTKRKTMIKSVEVSDARMVMDTQNLSENIGEDEDAAVVIESIRRDEFGLDPSLPEVEDSMLKKQHARLGRALHCLSQELYSQDSHFLLELVRALVFLLWLSCMRPFISAIPSFFSHIGLVLPSYFVIQLLQVLFGSDVSYKMTLVNLLIYVVLLKMNLIYMLIMSFVLFMHT